MNLLLLLSALLSALSGIAGGTRAPAQQQAVVCPLAASVAKPAAHAAAIRPSATIVLASVASVALLATEWRLPALAPLWALRRRE